MRIVLTAIALIIVGGIVYIFLSAKNIPQQNVQNVQHAQEVTQNPTLMLQGTVTSVDASKMQITLQVSTTSPLKVITISPATKIEKVISQKDANGKVEKQVMTEVNIEDLQKGSQVSIFYKSERGDVLDGVDRITFTMDGNVDAYIKQLPQTNKAPSGPPLGPRSEEMMSAPPALGAGYPTVDSYAYVKVEVVSIDLAGKKLSYRPYIFLTLGTTTESIAFPDGIATYRVDSEMQVTTAGAKTAIVLKDIKPKQTIIIQVDKNISPEKIIVPLEFIVLGK